MGTILRICIQIRCRYVLSVTGNCCSLPGVRRRRGAIARFEWSWIVSPDQEVVGGTGLWWTFHHENATHHPKKTSKRIETRYRLVAWTKKPYFVTQCWRMMWATVVSFYFEVGVALVKLMKCSVIMTTHRSSGLVFWACRSASLPINFSGLMGKNS